MPAIGNYYNSMYVKFYVDGDRPTDDGDTWLDVVKAARVKPRRSSSHRQVEETRVIRQRAGSMTWKKSHMTQKYVMSERRYRPLGIGPTVGDDELK